MIDENKTDRKDYYRNYYRKNKAKRRAYFKKYYKENKEKIRQRNREKRQKECKPL